MSSLDWNYVYLELTDASVCKVDMRTAEHPNRNPIHGPVSSKIQSTEMNLTLPGLTLFHAISDFKIFWKVGPYLIIIKRFAGNLRHVYIFKIHIYLPIQ